MVAATASPTLTGTGSAASLVLSPPSAAAGEQVTVTGAGFPPSAPIVISVGPPQEGAPLQELTRTTSDASGVFVFPFTAPDSWPDDGSAIPDGTLVVVASTEDGNTTAAANLTYTAGTVEATDAATGEATAQLTPAGTGTPSTTGPMDTYINETYKVSFQYPAEWTSEAGDLTRYTGDDGFFMIQAGGGSGITLQLLCEGQNLSDTKPYGTNLTLTYITVAGQAACLITPDTDQPPQMKDQAALIVTYLTPITTNGASYQYFVVYADEDHLMDPIAATLTFLP
jgi:hypothetical protein